MIRALLAWLHPRRPIHIRLSGGAIQWARGSRPRQWFHLVAIENSAAAGSPTAMGDGQ